MNGLMDMHVHTDDSPDADIPASALLARAKEEGITGLGFVAHLDMNPEDYCYAAFDPDGYERSLARAEEETPGTVLFRGIEFGEPHRFGKAAEEITDPDRFDFVIGALHSTRRAGLVLGPEVFCEYDPMEVIEEYIDETLEMVSTARMDVLAHFGLFRRGMAMAGLETSGNEMELFPRQVDMVLTTMIDREIALELNTSGLRRRERTTYPVPSILKRYRELGGDAVTLGSDTHREPYVFYGLEAGRDILLEAGFTHTRFWTSEGRRKHQLPRPD